MKKVFIHLVSNSLGDTIASIPYVSEYQKKHNVEVIYSVNDPYIILLCDSYNNIQFVGRNENIEYDEKISIEYNFNNLKDVIFNGDKLTKVEIDDTYPSYLLNNLDKYKHMIKY